EARADGRRQDVYPLVHAVKAHYLRAQDAARVRVEERLYAHVPPAGVVARVAGRVAQDLRIAEARGLGGLLVQARHRSRHVEDLDDRRALRALVLRGYAADVVRGDAALLVRRAGQGHQRG